MSGLLDHVRATIGSAPVLFAPVPDRRPTGRFMLTAAVLALVIVGIAVLVVLDDRDRRRFEADELAERRRMIRAANRAAEREADQ